MTSIGDILTEDIRRQKEIAEQALAKARVFQEAASGSSDPMLKDAADTLVDIARRLAANSATVSSTAAQVIRQGDKR